MDIIPLPDLPDPKTSPREYNATLRVHYEAICALQAQGIEEQSGDAASLDEARREHAAFCLRFADEMAALYVPEPDDDASH